jgi:hypothetical protein
MSMYIQKVQARLKTKKIEYKKEFLKEIAKEVRVRGKEIISKPQNTVEPSDIGPWDALEKALYTVGSGGRSRNRTYDLAHVRRAL